MCRCKLSDSKGKHTVLKLINIFFIIHRWLKKKNQDTKKDKKDDKQRQRIHKLMVRRTRKAVALARAIKQSQSFRYVDYYGYRY